MKEKREFVASPNFWGGRKEPCSVLVYHYTAGGSLDGTVKYLKKPGLQASAHFVIGRNGKIIQMVKTTDRSWHAGISSWKERSNVNNFSIGIEICNWGPLTKKETGLYCWTGAKFNGEYETDPLGRCWEKYPQAQIDAVITLTKELLQKFPEIKLDNIVGHEQIAPGRKIDPGFAFPWDYIKMEMQKWLDAEKNQQIIELPKNTEMEESNEEVITEEISKRSGDRKGKTDLFTVLEYSFRIGTRILWDWLDKHRN